MDQYVRGNQPLIKHRTPGNPTLILHRTPGNPTLILHRTPGNLILILHRKQGNQEGKNPILYLTGMYRNINFSPCSCNNPIIYYSFYFQPIDG